MYVHQATYVCLLVDIVSFCAVLRCGNAPNNELKEFGLLYILHKSTVFLRMQYKLDLQSTMALILKGFYHYNLHLTATLKLKIKFCV